LSRLLYHAQKDMSFATRAHGTEHPFEALVYVFSI
jgi:hypothetical protein